MRSSCYVMATNIEVYQEVGFAEVVGSIDRGAFESGNSISITVYFINTSDVR